MKPNDSKVMIDEFWSLLNEQKWADIEKLLSDDFEAILPQSREKFDRDGFIESNRNNPGPHKYEVQNLHHEEDRWDWIDTVVSEVIIKTETPDNENLNSFVITVFEIQDERIMGITQYRAESHAAPEWRKKWANSY
ncbi:MAG TPA: nuclear transport factor 2 family protein [Bacteriovoracaceae bacterium]|nr:nuclear transport factor 2 family protein [Bacteriovoracaceae bacterium]